MILIGKKRTELILAWFHSYLILISVLQEKEIKVLQEVVQQLNDPARLLANGFISPQLEALKTENAKLKYQITHLKRVGTFTIDWQLFIFI